MGFIIVCNKNFNYNIIIFDIVFQINDEQKNI